MRFFKKLEPKNSPVLGNGSSVKFNTLDTLTGYYATTNEFVIGELLALMAQGRYGITEITAEEFTENYIEPKKNGQRSKPIWREEIGVGGSVRRGIPVMEQLGQQRVEAAVAVAAKPEAPAAPVPASVVEPVATGPAPTPLKETVRTGRRSKKSSEPSKPI